MPAKKAELVKYSFKKQKQWEALAEVSKAIDGLIAKHGLRNVRWAINRRLNFIKARESLLKRKKEIDGRLEKINEEFNK